MSEQIRNKIKQSLDSMNDEQLQSAWLILKEFSTQQHQEVSNVDDPALNEKISIGIQQLEDGEGTNFGQFLIDLEMKYGNKL